MSTPFEILGLEPAFQLDAAVLEQKLIEANLRWHPDRYALAPEADRLAAEDQMAAINEAHDALVDPLNRAEVLLGEKAANRVADPMFLMEMMELREEVEAAIGKGDEAMATMHRHLCEQEAAVLQKFGQSWNEAASSGSLAASDSSVNSASAELQKHYQHARYLRSSRRQLEQAMHAQI